MCECPIIGKPSSETQTFILVKPLSAGRDGSVGPQGLSSPAPHGLLPSHAPVASSIIDSAYGHRQFLSIDIESYALDHHGLIRGAELYTGYLIGAVLCLRYCGLQIICTVRIALDGHILL